MEKIFYTCQVIKAGAADNGNIYIALDCNLPGRLGSSFWDGWRWFSAIEAQKKEMLAVALAAITSNLDVEAEIEPPPDQYKPIYRLYLKRK